MKLTVKFVDSRKDMMTVEGDNIDYAFVDGFLVITSDKCTEFPKKKVTFPVSTIFCVIEENEK